MNSENIVDISFLSMTTLMLTWPVSRFAGLNSSRVQSSLASLHTLALIHFDHLNIHNV
jgi:hypothetical protein